jgi:polysaccharide deacetylase 2 family uncharacterized protein YibQ
VSPSKAGLPRWKVRLFWVLLISDFVLGAIKVLDQPEPGINFLPKSAGNSVLSQKEALRFSVYQVLFDFGIRVDWITGSSRSKTVRIPRDLSPLVPYAALVTNFRRLGGTILRAESNPQGDKFVLEVGIKNEPLFRLTMIYDTTLVRVGGKIALVIDDFGYSYNSVVRKFLNLRQRITFSIIPGLSKSQQIAQAAFENNREVMIHLPMEPNNGKVARSEFMLFTQMRSEEIRERVRKAIWSIPRAKGLNNHMGSKATADESLLSTLMEEIKKSGLFFLDSRTSPKSLAYSWAQKMNIPSGTNDTFLDAIDEEPFIRQQIYLLAEIATKRGYAIGIGHPKKLTLKILQDELPNLERKGYKFVSISEVVR